MMGSYWSDGLFLGVVLSASFSFSQGLFSGAPADVSLSSSGLFATSLEGLSAPGDVVSTNSTYNMEINISNDVEYDVAPMSLEVGVARGLAAAFVSDLGELGNTNAISQYDSSNLWEYVYDDFYGSAGFNQMIASNGTAVDFSMFPSYRGWFSSSAWNNLAQDAFAGSGTASGFNAVVVSNYTLLGAINPTIIGQAGNANNSTNSYFLDGQRLPPTVILTNLDFSFMGVATAPVGQQITLISPTMAANMGPMSDSIHNFSTIAVRVVTALSLMLMAFACFAPGGEPVKGLLFYFLRTSGGTE